MKKELEKLQFVDLHRHSEYSLLDGSIKIKDMVDNTYYAGALTDHGNMFGHLKYYKEMKKQGKIPIIGIEGYMPSINGKKDRNHIILLCKNQAGYKNLSVLTSGSYNTENFYYKPHITWEALETHSQGLICLSACMGGELAKSVLKRDEVLSRKIIERFLNIFHDDFYIEVQRHFIENENYLNSRLIELAKSYNIKVVATTDAHYLKKEDAKVHEILLAMQTKSTLQDKNRFKFKGQNYHLQSQEEMQLLWSDHPEFLTNTLEVLEKCRDFKIELDRIYMPKFKIPKEFSSEKDYLQVLIWQGLKAKRLENNQQYIERIIKELTIIDNMGFIGYFLIVQDFINYAKKRGIAVGPGRGSAGGSLICYLIGITEIDPIKNDLIFERFLNPDRVSLPDIDVDFADSNREDVIEYVKHKYGVENVSNIITFGTMGARMILRDVTRTLDKPYWLGDKLAKMVPERPGITLQEALEESLELTNFINGNSDAKKILEYSMKLEGLPRHASQHACFVAGSKVSVENGEKNIEEIKVGDYVLTHKNRYKKVVDVMKKRVRTLMSITPDLYFRTITCTPDHPFLTCRVIDGRPLVQKLTEPVWKEAKDINVEEDLLCIPLTGRKGIIGWWLDTKNILFVRDNNYSTDGCVWIRPRQICIEQLSYQEDVYNLTVEDDSSYVVNGIAVHNCGVIISSEKIQEIIPEAIVGPKDNKARVTQVTMTECEDLGLLKMDFLGLRTMTVIQKSLAEINKKTGQNLKLGDIPIYDRSIYTLIAQGKNEGLFQIESEGMVSFLKQLFGDLENKRVVGRELFDRLVAGISLYRPGPMEYIPDYIKGMKRPDRVKYDHEKLKPILKNTYGQIVYQEQVMQIAVELGGYTMAQADTLRKAIGKKKRDVMEEEKPNFINGCVSNGIPEKTAIKIWDKMEKFCEYAFNKSHSTGYAIIAAQTAWLKYYFYKEYMAEVLNSYLQKPDKLSHYIESVKADGLVIERPDINNSGLYFKAGQDKSIIFGLSGIKNMGSFAEDVIKERMANGKYESFYDFLVRVHNFANTRAISSLIDSGAFDGLHPSRRGMKNKLNSILSSIRNQFKNNITGQLGFFNSQSTSIDQGQLDEEYTDFTKIELEHEATGMYITTHPVLLFKELLKKRSNVQDESQIGLGVISTQSQDHSGTNLLVGITTNLRNFHTSKGAHIMSFNIEDDRGKIKGVMFVNDDNINNSGYIQENGVVIMEGEIVTSEKYGKQFKVKFVQDSLDHCFPSARGVIRA